MKEELKDNVISRIEEFRVYCNLSVNSMCRSIGMNQSTVYNQLQGNRALSSDLIIAMLDKFSALSAEWLIRGRGDMLISKFGETPEGVTLKYTEQIKNLLETQNTLQDVINIKNSTIDAMSMEIEQLKKELSSLKSQAS